MLGVATLVRVAFLLGDAGAGPLLWFGLGGEDSIEQRNWLGGLLYHFRATCCCWTGSPSICSIVSYNGQAKHHGTAIHLPQKETSLVLVSLVTGFAQRCVQNIFKLFLYFKFSCRPCVLGVKCFHRSDVRKDFYFAWILKGDYTNMV